MSTEDSLLHPEEDPFNRQPTDEEEAEKFARWVGDFELTGAAVPGFRSQVVPMEGFRYDLYKQRTPIIFAAATRKKIMLLLYDLLDNLSPTCSVIVRSIFASSSKQKTFRRSVIDVPVLQSTLMDFEHLLLYDGCTSFCACDFERQEEVQLTPDKVFLVGARTEQQLTPYAEVLRRRGLHRNDFLHFISEDEVLRSMLQHHQREFHSFADALAAEEEHPGLPADFWDWSGDPDED